MMNEIRILAADPVKFFNYIGGY